MRKTKRIAFTQVLTSSALVLLIGCGGDDPASTPSTNGATADVGTTSDQGPDMDAVCTPSVTECSPTSCGMIGNGCGEMLDCGACTCEDGEPVQAECGPCNLGRIECASATEGSCIVPDVLTDKECDSVLFVEAGANGGNGSALTPFGTLANALSAAQSGDVILVAKKSTPYKESIVLKDGVSISGAWERQSKWIYDESLKAEFQVPAPSDDDVIGIIGEDLGSLSVLENLKVKTDNAAPTYNNYGFLGVGITGLLVRRLEVRSGTGGVGLDGADGQVGADGVPGTPAALWAASTCASTSVTIQDGGLGGVNPLCLAGSGGAGGNGMISSGGQLFPASPGSVASQGSAGGIAGIQVSNRESGGPGTAGVPFTTGAQNGARGQAFGEVIGDRWVVTGEGATGSNGGVGAGGGGGGGASINPSATGRAKTYGAAGGGGGAGGCGGTGGIGGSGGGGSFALFLSKGDFEIETSEFTSGLGGSGGRGGSGANGGSGGQGGRGLSVLCGVGVFVGGDGGGGANGQNGGSGAGGSGGVSYGGYCNQARVTLVDVSFDSLGAGLGGGGGVGAETGNTGETFDQYRCE